MKVTNVKDKWVSVVDDIDCGNLSSDEQNAIYDLFANRKVVIFKNQKLSNQQLKTFCSTFGQVWDTAKERYSGLEQSSASGHEDDFVETVSESGLLKSGIIPWHVDLTHFPSQLIPNRILYAVELDGSPAGTIFLDTVQGLNLIDKTTKEFLSTATALCKAPYQTPWDCYMRRPALVWHPVHNDYGLVADELFTQWIEGLPDGTNYKLWIRKVIIEKMENEQTVYEHNWQLNDLVLYDNWSTIHYRNAFEGTRRLKRVTWDQNWYTYGVNK